MRLDGSAPAEYGHVVLACRFQLHRVQFQYRSDAVGQIDRVVMPTIRNRVAVGLDLEEHPLAYARDARSRVTNDRHTTIADERALLQHAEVLAEALTEGLSSLTENDGAEGRLADARAYEIQVINKAASGDSAYIQLQSLEALKKMAEDPAAKLYG